MFPLTALQWGTLLGSAALVGVTKTGLPGLGPVVAPMMAAAFPVRASVAIVLPLLIAADLVAIVHFRRHVVRSYLIRLVPAALGGIVLGTALLRVVDDAQLRLLIALIVVATVVAGAAAAWRPAGGSPGAAGRADPAAGGGPASGAGAPRSEPRGARTGIAIALGILAGATSMVSNASGPILTAYLLAMRLPKHEFMGTGAWYYFILNLLKVPFHVAIGTMTGATLALNAVAAPVVLAGAAAGVLIVRRLPERVFRAAAMGLAVLAAGNLAVQAFLG